MSKFFLIRRAGRRDLDEEIDVRTTSSGRRTEDETHQRLRKGSTVTPREIAEQEEFIGASYDFLVAQGEKPTGRRRYDPNVERCRADSVGVKKNADGTTTKLSRGRFIPCSKQFRPSDVVDGYVEMVVSSKWVGTKERKALKQRVAVAKLLPKPKKTKSAQPEALGGSGLATLPEPAQGKLSRRKHQPAGGSLRPVQPLAAQPPTVHSRRSSSQSFERGGGSRRHQKNAPVPAPQNPGQRRRKGTRGNRNWDEE
jgi:hypothetical protein